MTPPCKFCQKDTVYVPLIIKGGNGDNRFHTFDVHYCYDCAAEYVKFGSTINVHLYTTINTKTYRWSVGDNNSTAQIWHIGEPGVPGVRPNRSLKLVKSFKDIYPDITPENIERKLRFMLVFL